MLALLLLGAWLMLAAFVVRAGQQHSWWYHLLHVLPVLIAVGERLRVGNSTLGTLHGLLLCGVVGVHGLHQLPFPADAIDPLLMLATLVLSSRLPLPRATVAPLYLGALDAIGHSFAASTLVGWSATVAATIVVVVSSRRRTPDTDALDEPDTRTADSSDIESAETLPATVRASVQTRADERQSEPPGKLVDELLDLVRRQLGATTVALYRLAGDDSFERVGAAEHARFPLRVRVSAHSGLIATLFKNRLPLLQNHIEQRNHQLAYHQEPEGVRHFAGILVEGGDGEPAPLLLLADRATSAPFTEQALIDLRRGGSLLRRLAAQHADLESARADHATYLQYFHASSRLNEALTLEQVYDALESVVEDVSPHASLAIVLADEAARRGTVVRANGSLARLTGQTLELSESLLSVALKNRHAFPLDGTVPAHASSILGHGTTWPERCSGLLLVPLVAKHEVIGALVLASATPFGLALRDLLVGVANQGAVAIDNGRTYRSMELLATHDGLTGLNNQRTFKARLGEVLARADRHQRPVTLLVADIDRFKSINDTYGHHNGDRVLRSVAAILREVVRKTDVLARYGGEEFVALLEETDEEGAALLAERVRSAVEAHPFTLDGGATLKATLSIGIASYPANANAAEALFKAADKALYAAKESGRNRCAKYSTIGKRHAA